MFLNRREQGGRLVVGQTGFGENAAQKSGTLLKFLLGSTDPKKKVSATSAERLLRQEAQKVSIQLTELTQDLER